MQIIAKIRKQIINIGVANAITAIISSEAIAVRTNDINDRGIAASNPSTSC